MESLLREAQELKEWIERAESLDNDQSSASRLNGHKRPVLRTKLLSSNKRARSNPILDKVAEIMLKEKRPMGPLELTELLDTMGIKVPGERPAANLSAKLCTAKARFKRIGYGQWVLADQ